MVCVPRTKTQTTQLSVTPAPRGPSTRSSRTYELSLTRPHLIYPAALPSCAQTWLLVKGRPPLRDAQAKEGLLRVLLHIVCMHLYGSHPVLMDLGAKFICTGRKIASHPAAQCDRSNFVRGGGRYRRNWSVWPWNGRCVGRPGIRHCVCVP